MSDFEEVDESPVRSLDSDASQAMVAEIDTARKANESLGGEFEVIAFGLVPGIGSHVSWEQRLDGRLAQAIMSIQALKGVGIGDGFALAERVGSKAHDEIFWSDEDGYNRETNRAGGIEGGMTTGDPLVVTGAMKPLPTLTKPLRSVDTETKEPAQALRERTDSCTVPAAGVVGEAMVALVLAAPTARSSAATTWTTCARRSPRTGTGSAGGAHSRALVLVGFMGAGKSTGARSLAAELGAEPLDSDRELERRLGEPVEAFFDREGEARVPRARGGARARAARPRGRAGGGARRRRGRLRARARGARAPHRGPPRGGARGGVAAGVGQGPAARPRPRPLRPAARRPRGAVRLGGRRAGAAGRPRRAAARAAGAPRARVGAGGHPARVGVRLVGRVPGVPRAAD